MNILYEYLKKINIAWLGCLGLIGFLGGLYKPLYLFSLFSLFFLSGLLRSLFHLLFMRNNQQKHNAKESLKYFFCISIGCFFNPWFFFQNLAQILGLAAAIIHVNAKRFKPENYKQQTLFSLPFEGQWAVAQGGISREESHSWSLLNQRYAYDFYIVDDKEKSYRNKGQELEDYYAFGKTVLAPADGIVVSVRDGINDYEKPGSGWVDWRVRDFRGNYVLMCHGAKEYSFIAHFKKNSIKVKPGEQVRCKQVIGLCGNTGLSTEPHIHFHLQNHPNLYVAVSLPIQFSNFCLKDGEKNHVNKQGYLHKGQKIANL